MPKLKLDYTALRQYRRDNGNQEQHTLSLIDITWKAVEGMAPSGFGQYGSAVVDLGILVLDAVLNPTEARLRAALGGLAAGVPSDSGRLALAVNLEQLASRVRMLALAGEAVETGENGKAGE